MNISGCLPLSDLYTRQMLFRLNNHLNAVDPSEYYRKKYPLIAGVFILFQKVTQLFLFNFLILCVKLSFIFFAYLLSIFFFGSHMLKYIFNHQNHISFTKFSIRPSFSVQLSMPHSTDEINHRCPISPKLGNPDLDNVRLTSENIQNHHS